jgi:hypothetical protein
MSEIKTKTTRIEYKKPKDRKINHFPDTLETVDLIIESLQKQIEDNKGSKQGIQNWSDFQFARWDATRHTLKEQMIWLKQLRHDIELADLEHDMAIDGAEVPF